MGHGSAGDGICPGWGYLLSDFLETIRNTDVMKFKYHPILLYVEIKDGYDGDDWTDYKPDDPIGKCQDHSFKYTFVKSALSQVFDSNFIELYKFLEDNDNRYPTLEEVAGKVVVYYPSPEFDSGGPAICANVTPFVGALTGHAFDHFTERAEVVIQNLHAPRVDQYQADWTFDYGAPPNPLVVDSSAQPPYLAPRAEGDSWEAPNGDVSHGEIVAEQGTSYFPYKTIGRALVRAEGTTAPLAVLDALRPRERVRAGHGWTMLVRPGVYRESCQINIPLTLKKSGDDGTVVIIGQPGTIVHSLWITLRPVNDGKDADTDLAIHVWIPNGRVLASFRQRRDKEHRRLFNYSEQLQLYSPVFHRELLSAVLLIDIAPNGRDHWQFDWQLDGVLSDGRPVSFEDNSINLDENNTHYERVLAV